MSRIGNTVPHQGTQVFEGMTEKFDEAMDLKKAIQAERKSIEDNPNMSKAEKDAAFAKLDQAEKAADNALDFTTNSGHYDTNSGSVRGDGDMSVVLAELARATDKLGDVVDSVKVSSQPIDAPSSSGGTSGASGTGGVGGAGAPDSSGGTSGASDLLNLANQDPDAFMSKMKNMSPEERQAAMFSMQQQMQTMNQMFSMMTNLAKVMHDTAKAAINNLRV